MNKKLMRELIRVELFGVISWKSVKAQTILGNGVRKCNEGETNNKMREITTNNA